MVTMYIRYVLYKALMNVTAYVVSFQITYVVLLVYVTNSHCFAIAACLCMIMWLIITPLLSFLTCSKSSLVPSSQSSPLAFELIRWYLLLSYYFWSHLHHSLLLWGISYRSLKWAIYLAFFSIYLKNGLTILVLLHLVLFTVIVAIGYKISLFPSYFTAPHVNYLSMIYSMYNIYSL